MMVTFPDCRLIVPHNDLLCTIRRVCNCLGNLVLISLTVLLLLALSRINLLHAAPAMWRAESIATLSAQTTRLTNSNGQTVATVSVPFVRDLVEIKRGLDSIAGIRSELWIAEGTTPNAWTAPYGDRNIITFNIPMLVAFGKDRDALAAVMGHEIAHLVRQHLPARQNNDAAVGFFGIIAGIVLEGMIQGKYQVSGLGQNIADLGATMAKTAFTRDQEREADKFGLEWVNEAGYDPQGALRLWKKMGELKGSPGFTFLSTHPSSSERFENLKQQIASLPTRRTVVASSSSSGPMSNSSGTRSETVVTDSSGGSDTKPASSTGIVESGIAAYQKGDYEGAVRYWASAAEKGDPRAQYALGTLYSSGQGVTKDSVKAAEFFRLAADQNYTVAQIGLSALYLLGSGVPKDPERAAILLEKASALGNTEASARFGALMFNGQGVAKDERKAVELFRVAAGKDNLLGQRMLGVAYMTGRGIDRDYSEAAKWFEKAANRGEVHSQNNLGVLYLNGQGVQKDEATALRYFRMASDRDDRDAKNNLANMYLAGQGVPKDLNVALRLYEEAHRKGNPAATSNIGVMYRDGLGVPKDLIRA